MRKNLFTFLGLVLAFFAPTQKAQAQGDWYTCGMRCEVICTLEQQWGRAAIDGTSNPLAMHYWMGCVAGSSCNSCGASSRGGDDSALAAALASSSATSIRALANANRPRILVSLRRNLLVIRGSDCNPDAFVAVSSVSRARARELVEMGIAELEKVSAPALIKHAN